MHQKIEVLEKLSSLNSGDNNRIKQAKSEIRSKPIKAINSFDIDLTHENTFNLPHLSTHKQT